MAADSLARRLAVRAGLRSREEKWVLYERLFPPRRGERVLDVGVSSFDHLPGENYFLRHYPFPEQLTGVGIQEQDELRRLYPQVTFVTADGRQLPFDGLSFDVVHSNAVVEHVGPEKEQRAFVHELVRVGRSGFVTTPNRWFPLDSHTLLPLGHWLPHEAFIRLLEASGRGKAKEWWLLGPSTFGRLFPPELQVKIRRLRLGGMTATLVAVWRR